jgi:hypothetical protein
MRSSPRFLLLYLLMPRWHLLLAPFIPSLPFTLLYVLPADAIRCCTAERLCKHGIRELLHLHMRMRLC